MAIYDPVYVDMNAQEKLEDNESFRLSKKRKQKQRQKKAESFKKLKLQYEECSKKLERITKSGSAGK